MAEVDVDVVRVVISGRVQGVGFRRWVEREATSRGLFGWVRNQPDGNVEALFAGGAERVRDMVGACHDGPGLARVDKVRMAPGELPRQPGFLVLR